MPLILFVAFLSLIINTLMYSVLAGDSGEGARPRAASIQVLNGLSFGLAVVLLLQGITLLIQEVGLDRTTLRVARFLTVAVLPCLVMYFIAGGTTDSDSARAQLEGACVSSRLPLEGTLLSGGVLVVLACSLLTPVQRTFERARKAATIAAPITVLLTTVAGAVAAADIGTRSPTFLFSEAAMTWYLRAVFALLIAMGLMLSFSGPTTTGRRDVRRIPEPRLLPMRR